MIAKFIHLLLRKLSGNTDLQTEQPPAQTSQTSYRKAHTGRDMGLRFEIEISRTQNNLNHAYI